MIRNLGAVPPPKPRPRPVHFIGGGGGGDVAKTTVSPLEAPPPGMSTGKKVAIGAGIAIAAYFLGKKRR